ncbi:MAG TPA: DNA gyrase inhibitor YacG [Verrucomicrobiae bacterium]|nr:DNA gyrase inhibitor YacG [Verrucomicrobiae bacterium]
MSTPLEVKCPTCRKSGTWFAGKYGPFCSHRCKLIDLGKWFSEAHTVSSPLRPEDLANCADGSADRNADRSESAGE